METATGRESVKQKTAAPDLSNKLITHTKDTRMTGGSFQACHNSTYLIGSTYDRFTPVTLLRTVEEKTARAAPFSIIDVVTIYGSFGVAFLGRVSEFSTPTAWLATGILFVARAAVVSILATLRTEGPVYPHTRHVEVIGTVSALVIPPAARLTAATPQRRRLRCLLVLVLVMHRRAGWNRLFLIATRKTVTENGVGLCAVANDVPKTRTPAASKLPGDLALAYADVVTVRAASRTLNTADP